MVNVMPRVSLFQSAIRDRLTWGFLPLERRFKEAFDADLGQDGLYKIRNCRELDAVYSVGSVDLTRDELWNLISDAEQQGWETNHELSDVVSSILLTLGFEWV
jgi:hypothetical protein